MYIKTGLKTPFFINFASNKPSRMSRIYVASSWRNKYQPEVVAGKGLKTIVYMPEKQEPELMYKLFDGVVATLGDLIDSLA